VLAASSPVRPAASRLRSAALAWLGILALGSDRATEAARSELASLAEFVTDGLRPTRPSAAG
jgi:hypothetical protein